jgi:hypothetical protein
MVRFLPGVVRTHLPRSSRLTQAWMVAGARRTSTPISLTVGVAEARPEARDHVDDA